MLKLSRSRRRLSGTPIVAQTLPQLRARVRAIYGERDALYRGLLLELQSALQSGTPRWSRWYTVPDAGHWVPYEAAERFNAVLLAALQP